MENNDHVIVKGKLLGISLFLTFIIIITLFFMISMFDSDKAVSEKENRGLTQFPKLSISTLFSGQFTEEFEKYYSDQFPMRDFFLSVNDKLNKLMQQFSSGGANDVVIVTQDGSGNDFGGESLHEREN